MKKSDITDTELLRRIDLAEQRQEKEIARGGFYHDPIEDDPKIGLIVQAAYDRATVELDQRFPFGLCHLIWHRTEEILAQEHGIMWYSPSRMNPGTRFD
jgi:hypothetical protein